MSIERAKQLIRQKENIRLEFKEATTALPTNLFESICAMLNREGGDIFLGVDDTGTIKGIEASALETIITNLVNLSNNPQKLDPPFILFPLKYFIDDKWIVQIQVPASSQLHKTGGHVYDRSNDGDFRVIQPHLIAGIYNSKRNHYTEGIIYPAVSFTDFKQELFPKVRNLIKSNEANHPWLALSDQEMLQKAGLWKRDFQNNQEGYTLAAVLLFGKDDVIQNIIPHYKTDALVRIHDNNRYDDRAYIQTNLIESYEKLMEFVAKHLPDAFHQEGDQRVSLRTRIFREVIANILVHREYTNAYPSTLVIYPDRVETKNANNPHGIGPINPQSFAPFPKNPAIAKFFIQLGWVDELGSGVLNVNRFIREYGGAGQPVFIEGDTFETTIPIPNSENNPIPFGQSLVNHFEGFSANVQERLIGMVKMIWQNPGHKIQDLSSDFNISERVLKENISFLKKAGIIIYKGSKKTGGYYLTDKFVSEIASGQTIL